MFTAHDDTIIRLRKCIHERNPVQLLGMLAVTRFYRRPRNAARIRRDLLHRISDTISRECGIFSREKPHPYHPYPRVLKCKCELCNRDLALRSMRRPFRGSLRSLIFEHFEHVRARFIPSSSPTPGIYHSGFLFLAISPLID